MMTYSKYIFLTQIANSTHSVFSSPDYTYEFTFNVKFYPPDPAQLTEDLTRLIYTHLQYLLLTQFQAVSG